MKNTTKAQPRNRTDNKVTTENRTDTSDGATAPVATGSRGTPLVKAQVFGCGECGRSFSTKTGLGVHRRAAHAEAFHAQAAQLNEQVKRRWTLEEKQLLARFDSGDEKKTVKDLQALMPSRTVEAIKGRRKTREHQDMVIKCQEELTLQEQEEEGAGHDILETQSEMTGGGIWQSHFETFFQDNRQCLDDLMGSKEVEIFGNHKIDSIFEEWYRPMTKPKVSKAPKAKMSREQQAGRVGRSERRRALRGLTQSLYEKSPEKCITSVLEGSIGQSVPILPGQYEFWSEIFSRSSHPDNREIRTPEYHYWETADPITLNEVNAAIGRLKDRAPGLDGLKKGDILKIPPTTLQLWFNIFLARGDVPTSLKQGITTLIPKVASPATPGEFRPVTMSSMLLRTFHQVLAARLSTIPVSRTQRGFQKFDGVGTSVWVVRTLINDRISKLKPLYIAFLDIRKAFDTVSHETLIKACERSGVPQPLVRYLSNVHKGNTTRLKEDVLDRDIPVNVGVRQGDPISTFLFNFVMDLVTERLSTKEVGVVIGGERISLGMLADDTYLVAESRQGLQTLVDEFNGALGLCGMGLNTGKCSSLAIEVDGKRKRWYVNPKCFLTLEGSLVTTLTIGSTYKYLGVKVATRRVDDSQVLQSLEEKFRTLSKSHLKPQQRMYAIRTFLLPATYHVLCLGDRKTMYLKALDKLVRRYVRQFLHLPHDTPTSYFYAPHGDGGLGVPSVYANVVRLRQERIQKMTALEDPVIDAVLGTEYMRKEAADSRRLVTICGKTVWKKSDIGEVFREALYSSVDGAGLKHHYESGYGSSWVIDPRSVLGGKEYVSAVQVRGSLLSTESRKVRGRTGSKRCKTCADRVGNLQHLLQVCPRSHGLRVRRHDALCAGLGRLLERKGFSLWQEPRIPFRNSFLKPDIVAIRSGLGLVLDPIVCADNCEFAWVEEQKVAKYQNDAVRSFVEREAKLSSQLPGAGAFGYQVRGIAVDWRGCWSPDSWNFLTRDLKVNPTALNYLSTRILNAAKDMWSANRQRAD